MSTANTFMKCLTSSTSSLPETICPMISSVACSYPAWRCPAATVPAKNVKAQGPYSLNGVKSTPDKSKLKSAPDEVFNFSMKAAAAAAAASLLSAAANNRFEIWSGLASREELGGGVCLFDKPTKAVAGKMDVATRKREKEPFIIIEKK